MLEIEPCVRIFSARSVLAATGHSIPETAADFAWAGTVRKTAVPIYNGAPNGAGTKAVQFLAHSWPKRGRRKNGDPRANRAYPARNGSVSIIEPGKPCCLGDSAVFSLDARLQQDTLLLGDFPLCRLLLSNDANYPWFILVPRQAAITEVFQLSAEDQQQLWLETSTLAAALNQTYAADKMNIGALGNVVSQLHMHVIVRFQSDVAWPSPVWGKVAAVPYGDEQVAQIKSRVRALQLPGLTLAGDAS
jgi:diadenosine tetraphosphate (Ap4A) HIT family hydrolase